MLEFNQSYDGGYQPQYNSGEATGNKKQLTQPVDQEAKEYIGRCVFTPRKTGDKQVNRKSIHFNLSHTLLTSTLTPNGQCLNCQNLRTTYHLHKKV